jgi:LPXTG-site transpeptidase (sortase) family protein
MSPDSRVPLRRAVWLSLPLLPTLLLVLWLTLAPVTTTQAAPILTAEVNTWDFAGVNTVRAANEPTPPWVPVGVRICSQNEDATNVLASFVWQATEPASDPFFTLIGPPTILIPRIPANECRQAFFQVKVTDDSGAWLTFREYRISVQADNVAAILTADSRAIWADELDRDNALVPGNISGPPILRVGDIVTYTVTGTSPSYDQLVSYVTFPNSHFRLISVTTTASNPGATVDGPYFDACGWDPNVNNLISTYATCVGPEKVSGGQVSGAISQVYVLEAIATGNVQPEHVLIGYDSADESFHFNQSTGGQIPTLTILLPANVTPSPTLSPTNTPTRTSTVLVGPNMSITPVSTSARPGDIVTYTVALANYSALPINQVRMEIPFPKDVTLIGIDAPGATAVKSLLRDGMAAVDLPQLAKSEVVTVTVLAQINAAPSDRTLSISGKMTYVVRGGARTVRSNTATLTVSRLVNTGLAPIAPRRPLRSALFYPALGLGGLLILGGLLAGLAAVRLRRGAPEWAGWFARIMVLLIGAGGVFALAGVLLLSGPTPASQYGLVGPGGRPQVTLLPNYRATGELPVIDPTYMLPTATLAPPPVAPPPEAAPETVTDGSNVTRLVIPRARVDAPVVFLPYNGRDWSDASEFRDQIAWLGSTSRPGLGGNTALAGHISLRDGSLGPFYYLADLAPGDLLFVHTEQSVYTYRVAMTKTVSDLDFSVTEPSAASQITLITCTDYDARLGVFVNRYVVLAELTEVQAQPGRQGSR